MQTLDARRHSAGANYVDFGNLAVFVAVSNVRRVRRSIRLGNALVRGQSVLFGRHETVRFER
jgi:hypothetical protein